MVDARDDLYLEVCTLHNLLGNYQIALQLLSSRQFHPWEGGEGKVTAQYLYALIALARIEIKNNNFENAISHLEKTIKYPTNLGEGKLTGVQENDIHFWFACAYTGLRKTEVANQYLVKATIGLSIPSAAVFYNDQQPDKIFYQGLACLKLNKNKEAETRFNNLINYGTTHMNDDIKIDYFAVSLPDLLIWEDNLNTRNKIHCNYLIALGNLGLNKLAIAKKQFQQVLELDINHSGATTHLELLTNNFYSQNLKMH